MSEEAIKLLIEKMEQSPEFRKQLEECLDEQERIDLAKSNGCEVTDEELKKAMSALSQDNLDGISGGFTYDGFNAN